MRRTLTAALAATILGPAGAAPAAAAQPTIAFETHAVVVSGLTPGGTAVIFSMAREIYDYAPSIVRRDLILEDEDGDGVVRIDLGAIQVTPRGVWAAADYADGHFAVATANPLGVWEIDAHPQGLGANAQVIRQLGRTALEIMVMRPGTGAWGLTTGDAGAVLATHPLEIFFADMVPIGASPPPPDRLHPRDVIVMIDPRTFETYARQLAAH